VKEKHGGQNERIAVKFYAKQNDRSMASNVKYL